MSYMQFGLAFADFAADIWSANKQDEAQDKSRKKTKKELKELFKSTKRQLQYKRDIEIRQLDRAGKLIKGSQRAGYAASGVKVDTGTPLEVAMDTNAQIAVDRQIIKTSYDLEVDAALKRSKAGMPQQVPSTLGPTVLQSGMTLLTSASQHNYWGLLE